MITVASPSHRPAMPPARRGRANKAKANGDLSLGDLVLAKVKGFPAWPAKVRIPSSNVLVFFFFFLEFRWCLPILSVLRCCGILNGYV